MIGATEEIVPKQIYVCVYKIIKRIIKKKCFATPTDYVHYETSTTTEI